ncbi:MAG: MFS transporter [Aeromicrobium sp.]
MKLKSAQGRWLIAATVLGSGLAFLDGTIVNIALPAIERDLGSGVAGLQWTISAYTLSLAALILVGGSLGDRWGRRRVFVVGVAWFAVASLFCAISPTIGVLVAARAVQGIGAALLTPGSLALISASMDEEDRGAAIGAWSGLAGVSTAFGPLLGGWLVEAVSWRAVFYLNLPIAAGVVWITLRHVPESKDDEVEGRIDFAGAVLTAAGLAALTYGLVGSKVMPSLAGVALLAAFVIQQRRSPHALVPLELFANRTFTAANLSTFAVYAALSGAMFLLVLQLQYVSGYSPLESGVALLPIAIVMLLFSARAGRLGQRIGPRLPMTIGPMVGAAGLLLLMRIGEHAPYVTSVLPGVLIFSAGLTLLVAPLTTAVLGAAPTSHSGIASGINNALARTASLLAVAALPPIVGIAGADFADPDVFSPGFRMATVICAGLLIAGGVISGVLIRNKEAVPDAVE